jgi:hypothetical protein
VFRAGIPRAIGKDVNVRTRRTGAASDDTCARAPVASREMP